MDPRDPLHRVAVALDTHDRERFAEWCRLFGPKVGWLKVGLESFVRFGPGAVEEAAAVAQGVFLDLKLHDIPHTVAGAVRSAADLGARLLTVHAAAGRRVLEAAAEATAGRLGLLAVTVLTHLEGRDLEELGEPGSVAERVVARASLARQAGCAGVVCSVHEAARLRRLAPSPFLLVTPGIRPPGAETFDQRRTATPGEAVRAGADLLVVGRPLTRAVDPGAALSALSAALSEALDPRPEPGPA